MPFETWLEEVDKAVQRICGLSCNDLADQPFYDWYRSDMSPEEAAWETLEDNGFPFDAV